MRISRSSLCLLASLGCCLSISSLSSSAFAANRPLYKPIYRFEGLTDGSQIYGPVIDRGGVLYGSAQLGGDLNCGYDNLGCGTVFTLTPPTTSGGAWTETTLYAFEGANSDGQNPWGPVVFDKSGNLYGVTYNGGNGAGCANTYGCGTVYRLTPPSTSGGSWTESILYSFQGGDDGAFPSGQLAVDGAGNVYGTTTEMGGGNTNCNPFNCGTVFELSPPTVSGGTWTETILHSFTGGADGALPDGNLVLGPAGVVYGAASIDGANNAGTIFELKPAGGGTFTFSVIYDFPGFTDGRIPGYLNLRQGDLYGATSAGPGSSAGGTVFKLSQSGGVWTSSLLFAFTFDSTAGFEPWGPLAFDTKGNIYGTTSDGGNGSCNFGCGTVFELSLTESGAYTESVLHSFQADDGHYPQGLVMSGSALYGTTSQGGGVCASNKYGCGTVFSVVP